LKLKYETRLQTTFNLMMFVLFWGQPSRIAHSNGACRMIRRPALARSLVVSTSIFVSACTYEAEPADALADAIVQEARQLLDQANGAQVTLERSIESKQPYVVALLPDDADVVSVVRGVSQDDARLLEQIHHRRKKGSATLIVLVGNRWSSVDYLADSLDVPTPFLVMKRAGEVVKVRVQRLGKRPRILSIE
jgi:hypothetical protein